MEWMKALKHIGTIATGSALLGATVMGAVATDLADFPSPFIKDGELNSLIVVGANADTADVLGSIDVVAALQAANTVTEYVDQELSTVEVEGDSFRLDKSSDPLELDEDIDGVGYTTLTSSQLDSLEGGTVANSKGTSTYTQELQVADSAEVLFTTDSDDTTDTRKAYLHFDTSTEVYDYTITFVPALQSDIDSNDELEDIEDVKISMLGLDYKVTDADLVGANSWQIDLMAGSVEDSITIGETKTYSLGTSDYEVTLTFVDSSNVKFSVNGESTKQLAAGDTEVLSDGTEIAVDEILYQSYAGGVQMVQFFLGASKITVTDTDTSTAANGDSVTVGSNTVTDVIGDIRATNTSTEGRLTSIRFVYTADENIHVDEGGKLSGTEEIDDNQMFLNFDIEFWGDSVHEDVEEFSLDGQGDDEYTLKFYNKAGDYINLPLFDVDTSTIRYGDENDDLIVAEADVATFANATAAPGGADHTEINVNDYFVVAKSSATFLLRYKDLDAEDDLIEFEDVGSGDTIVVDYDFTDNTTKAGDINMGGAEFWGVWVGADANDAPIMVSLDGDASLEDSVVPTWRTKEGGKFVVNVTGADGEVTFTSEDLDDTEAGEDMEILFNSPSTDNIDISAVTLEGSSFLGNVDDQSDDQNGMGVWGTLVTLKDNDNGPDTLEFTYPDEQTEYLVYYTSGATTATEGWSGSSFEAVQFIGVGAAVLDSEVTDLGAQNVIVIGGPCVNTAAAELMGNPASCAEGFEDGKGMVKLFEQTNGNIALLIAGYSAMDTRRTASALAQYTDYEFSGMEVEVTGDSLTEFTVSMSSQAMDS